MLLSSKEYLHGGSQPCVLYFGIYLCQLFFAPGEKSTRKEQDR